jgi:hypothetical protein
MVEVNLNIVYHEKGFKYQPNASVDLYNAISDKFAKILFNSNEVIASNGGVNKFMCIGYALCNGYLVF